MKRQALVAWFDNKDDFNKFHLTLARGKIASENIEYHVAAFEVDCKKPQSISNFVKTVKILTERLPE